MEARLTVLECSQERIAEHQHKAEDTVMTILEGFQRRFEEIEYSTPINFGATAVSISWVYRRSDLKGSVGSTA
ncbi:hypothetical protein QR680_007673 [Steinernema hermaphroditum]|uniref:Uncharacterized protein n=1 Tax=Steinernema hermaphroditum TaxID=289476 RepID=A0AA39IDX3_9BILA|nr:hypothetical protein QR680_007673 [Steinernema hermaphroditum]